MVECYVCGAKATRRCDWCNAPLCVEHMATHTTEDCKAKELPIYRFRWRS